jgi:hypothetical protein
MSNKLLTRMKSDLNNLLIEERQQLRAEIDQRDGQMPDERIASLCDEIEQLRGQLAKKGANQEVNRTSKHVLELAKEIADLRKRISGAEDRNQQEFMTATKRIQATFEAENRVMWYSLKIDALALLPMNDASIDGLKQLAPALEKAYKEARQKLLIAYTDDDMPQTIKQGHQRIVAVERAINPDNPEFDNGDSLRELVRSFDPGLASIADMADKLAEQSLEDQRRENERIAAELAEKEAETERLLQEAVKQALDAKKKEHITPRTKEQQRLREQAIEELRAVRHERPDWSITRLRDHYISKYESSIPPGKHEVFEYIQNAADSTLYSWQVF